MKFRNLVFATMFSLFTILSVQPSSAAEPGWYPYVISRGPDRGLIQRRPMIYRPNRPMHFYGNAVRRNHYRGMLAPQPRGLARPTTRVFRGR